MLASRFDEVIDRRGSGSLKWWGCDQNDVLPMWVADMDFAAPPAVIDAIQRRVAHRVLGYSRPTRSLIATIQAYFRNQHQVELDPDWIVWLSGCVPALSMACGTVGEAGDEVVTFSPVYPPFLHVHGDHDRTSCVLPLVQDQHDRHQIPWDDLDHAASPRTRVLLFCNPHNPVGRVYTRDEVTRLAQWCHERDVVLCSDELHCDLVLEPAKTPHVTAVSLPGKLRDRTITLMSASKTYNIAGLACAFAIVPSAELRRRFLHAAGKMLPEISPLSLAACEAAYGASGDWRAELLAYLRQSRDRMIDWLRAELPEVKVVSPEATYLLWLDLRGLRLDEPARHFKRFGLWLSDGREFGTAGFVRLNFGCPWATIESGLERFRQAVLCRPEQAAPQNRD